MAIRGQTYVSAVKKIPENPEALLPEPRSLCLNVLMNPNAYRGQFDYEAFCQGAYSRYGSVADLLFIEDRETLDLEPGESIVLCLQKPRVSMPLKYVIVKRSDTDVPDPQEPKLDWESDTADFEELNRLNEEYWAAVYTSKMERYTVYGYPDDGFMDFFSKYGGTLFGETEPFIRLNVKIRGFPSTELDT